MPVIMLTDALIKTLLKHYFVISFQDWKIFQLKTQGNCEYTGIVYQNDIFIALQAGIFTDFMTRLFLLT